LSAISVRYVYSACVIIETEDARILCDPWFTEGIYDGSWFHFPKVADPLGSIGEVSHIYISHIHPDHYDPDFLHSYFEKVGEKPLLISDLSPNFLQKKMFADGFSPVVLAEGTTLELGETWLQIMPHKTGSISDIDSALIVKSRDGKGRIHCVVNANDIVFDEDARRDLKETSGEVDILLCGYTGAGPYPQTYFDFDDPALSSEAEKKKQAFFDRYRQLTECISAKVNLPFAGKYVLGGKLSKLNFFRGVADPVEVLRFDPNAVVLADNGGEISTSDFEPTRQRTEPYALEDIRARIEEIESEKLDYERLISESEIHQLPLKRLLASAYHKAVSRSEVEDDYYFVFPLNDEFIVLNANRNEKPKIDTVTRPDDLPTPRSEVDIDPRYLFGLLTHVYHWNNAEVGSQFQVRRTPNVFDRSVQGFLNFLAV